VSDSGPYMQVCMSLQTDNHANTPPLTFYRLDAFPVAQPTAPKHWRQLHYDWQNSNPNVVTSDSVYFANPKSDGYTELSECVFKLNFCCFGRPTCITHCSPPLDLVWFEQSLTPHSTQNRSLRSHELLVNRYTFTYVIHNKQHKLDQSVSQSNKTPMAGQCWWQ